jgi:hypothetical protein
VAVRELLRPGPVGDSTPLHKGKADLNFRIIALITKRDNGDNL